MSLLDFLEDEPEDPMVNAVQTLSEKIRQRRHQMLIHSYIYYHLDDNIVSDDKWQQWADELVSLQEMWNTLGMTEEELLKFRELAAMITPDFVRGF